MVKPERVQHYNFPLSVLLIMFKQLWSFIDIDGHYYLMKVRTLSVAAQDTGNSNKTFLDPMLQCAFAAFVFERRITNISLIIIMDYFRNVLVQISYSQGWPTKFQT